MDINSANNTLKVNTNPLINTNNNSNNNALINNNLQPIITPNQTMTNSIGNSNSNAINNNNSVNSNVVNTCNNSNMNAIRNLNNYNNNNHNKSHAIIKDKTIDTTVRQQLNHNKVVTNSQTNHKSAKPSAQPSHPSPRQLSSPLHPMPAPRSRHNVPDGNASPAIDPLMDRTPCGSESLTPSSVESYETPPHIRWAQDFYYLIDDKDGVALFKEYLKRESGLDYLLDFWFACRGLKSEEDKEVIKKWTNVIFKKFIRKCVIKDISSEVRDSLCKKLGADSSTPIDPTADSRYDRHVFDGAQQEVEDQLKGPIYVNFLRSELYLNYYHKHSFPDSQGMGATGGYDEPLSVDDSTASSAESSQADDYNPRNQLYEVLPTLHEEHELSTTYAPMNVLNSLAANTRSQVNRKFHSSQPPVDDCQNLMSSGSSDTLNRRLNSLAITRRSTSMSAANGSMPSSSSSSSSRVTTESHPISHPFTRLSHPGLQSYARSASMPLPPHPYHVLYAPKVLPSAQDSEVSTNESSSLVSAPQGTDGNDGSRMRTKKQHMRQQDIQQNAKLNSQNNDRPHNRNMIPVRPQQPPPQPHTVEDFAKQLIEKLEVIRKKRDDDQEADQKLKSYLILCGDTNSKTNVNANCPQLVPNSSANTTGRPNHNLKDMFKQRLDFCSPPGDSGQDILDNHIAQVFADTPIVTPTDSIGAVGGGGGGGRCLSPPKNTYYNNSYINNMTGGSQSAPPPPVNYTYDPSGADNAATTVAIVKYSTEPLPYRLMISGTHITLRKFKNRAKPGNWQYYFKRQCSEREAKDISAPFVLEQITDDNQRLPLIDNKIFAELQESN